MLSSVSTSPLPTVAEALRAAAQQLAEVTDTARLDAELLMAHALAVTRSELLLRHTRDPAPAAFSALLERRMNHEPVAYILGEQEFRGLTLTVTPAVLIPRADSETTLEAALEAAPDAKRVLDCGTGSGALLLAFLAERPQANGIGIDRSPAALGVAAANAERHGLSARATMLEADWETPGWAADLGRFDLIIANPPYVETTADIASQVRDHEPAGALFAGPEGLDAYRILIPQLSGLLAAEGTAVLEIGAPQADAVRSIAEQHGFSCDLRHDLGGRARALILRLGLGKAGPSV